MDVERESLGLELCSKLLSFASGERSKIGDQEGQPKHKYLPLMSC